MPGPSSIRSSTTQQTTFDNSAFGPSITITRKDLSNSTCAYQRLLSASKAYTQDTLNLANSSSELASALDECSRLKGAHESSSQLQALSGLYYLVSSYNQVLADSFWKDFSIPLLNHFDTYNQNNVERSLINEKSLMEKSKVLKEMEMKNLHNGRRKERDLNSFRKALNELQQQVEEIDRIKSDYYHELLQSEEECWKLVMEKVALLTRSHLDISERLTSKGSSDPILEPLLSSIPDPFNSYGPERTEDQIFSILQSANPNSTGSNFLNGGGLDGVGERGDLSPSGLGLMSPSTPIIGLPRSASGPKEKEKESSSNQSLSKALEEINKNSNDLIEKEKQNLNLKSKNDEDAEGEEEEETTTSSALFGSEEGGDFERSKDDLLGPSRNSHSRKDSSDEKKEDSSASKSRDGSENLKDQEKRNDERDLKVLSIINETSSISVSSSDEVDNHLESESETKPKPISQSKPLSKDESKPSRAHSPNRNLADPDEEADFSNDESVRGAKVNGSENGTANGSVVEVGTES